MSSTPAIARRLCLLAVSTCMLFAIATSSASAAVIEIRSCHPDAYPATALAGDRWAGSANSASSIIRTSNNCPDGLRFDTSKQVAFGARSQFSFGLESGLRFDSVRLKYRTEGPDTGFAFSIHACDACAAVLSLPPTGGTEIETETVDLSSSNKFFVRAECVQAVCAASGSMKFNSIVLRATDSAAPQIISASVTGGWRQRSKVTGSFKVYDIEGVGIRRVTARVLPNSTYLWNEYICSLEDVGHQGSYFGPSSICPWGKEFSGPLDLRDVPDGTHTIQLTAEDGLGNSMSPWTATIKLDDTPPETPQDANLSGVTSTGWSITGVVAAAWRNNGETTANTVESGIAYSYFDLEPRSGTATDPQAVGRFGGSDAIGQLGDIQIPEDGEWNLYLWTVDVAGNLSGKQKLFVGRDSDVPAAPELATIGWLNRETLLGGHNLTWARPDTAMNESGVCGYAITFNATADSSPTSSISHQGDVTAAVLPAALPEGSTWAHVRTVSCAGLASPVAHQEIKVDLTPPQVRVEDGYAEGWQNSSGELELRAEDDASGVAKIDYVVGGSAPNSVAGDSASISLADGDHSVSFSAVDHAGNHSPDQTISLKLDRAAPTGTFLSRDQNDPARVTARLSDDISGMASAEIQIRNEASADWMPLPTSITVDASAPKRWVVDSRIPDATLPRGNYQLRVLAADPAGNRSLVDDLNHTGIPMSVSLPARSKTTLTAALAPVKTKCKPLKKRGCATSTKCKKIGQLCTMKRTFDRTSARNSLVTSQSVRSVLIGSASRSDGTPLANAAVRIDVSIGGGSAKAIGTAVTDADGAFTFDLPAGPSRQIEVAYSGTLTQLPQSATASIGIRAKAKLRVKSRRVKGGRLLQFSGQMSGMRAEHPTNQVFVVLEFRNGRTWQTGIGKAKVDRRGRFVVSPAYFAKRVAGGVKILKVRAYIRAAGSEWPYLDGYSNVVSARMR